MPKNSNKLRELMLSLHIVIFSPPRHIKALWLVQSRSNSRLQLLTSLRAEWLSKFTCLVQYMVIILTNFQRAGLLLELYDSVVFNCLASSFGSKSSNLLGVVNDPASIFLVVAA